MSKVVAEPRAEGGCPSQVPGISSGTQAQEVGGREQTSKVMDRRGARCPSKLGAMEGFCTEEELPKNMSKMTVACRSDSVCHFPSTEQAFGGCAHH